MSFLSSSPHVHHHHSSWLDRLGGSLALICAVHCLLTPMLVVCLPLIASTFWVNESFHLWMLGLVVPLTALSMFLGCRKHHDRLIVGLATIGISFLITGVICGFVLGHSCHTHCGDHHSVLSSSFFPHGWESFFTTLGGGFLVFAHIRNYRLCRKTSCDH